MSDDAVRRALDCLAHSECPGRENDESPPSTDPRPTFRETIERATAAIDDVEAAAQFVEDVGLDELEQEIELAERSVSTCADDGRRALTAFREFREAAEGVRPSEARASPIGDRSESIGIRANEGRTGSGENSSPGEHFHLGHGTSLGCGDIAPGE